MTARDCEQMASDNTPHGAPRYTWKMLSSAHMAKRKKLRGFQKQLGQMFSIDAYDFQSSDSDLSAASAGVGLLSTELPTPLPSSDTVVRIDEVGASVAERERSPKSGTSIAEEPSLRRIKASHRPEGSKHKALGKAVKVEALQKKMRPSIRISGSEEEGTTDCVPETSQELLPTYQPNSHVPLSEENVDLELEAVPSIGEASSRVGEGAQDGPGARLKRKKHKRRELHDTAKLPKKKKKKRSKERMQEDSTQEGWEPW